MAAALPPAFLWRGAQGFGPASFKKFYFGPHGGGGGGGGGPPGGDVEAAAAPSGPDAAGSPAALAAFATTQMRNGFVRKVLGILAVQLAITVGFSAACFYSPTIKARALAAGMPGCQLSHACLVLP